MRNIVCDKGAREKVGSDVGRESDKYTVFPTQFPEATGVTLVISPTNFGDDALSLTDGLFHNDVWIASNSTTTGDRT